MILSPDEPFPHLSSYVADATATSSEHLVAMSEELTPMQILTAYRVGVFPWYEDDDSVYWFSVAPRAVLLPSDLHVSRSLRKSMKNQIYRITVNHHFAAVMAACAHTPRPHQDGTWISPRFQAAYTALHEMGHAHSFEYYNQDNELVGGLYGVQIGSVFFGESMFSRQPNASKITFAHAVPFLAKCGIKLIDCQQDTVHLRRFGSHLMAFSAFQAALKDFTHTPLQQEIAPQTLVSFLGEQYV